jgi:hypothetical protein
MSLFDSFLGHIPDLEQNARRGTGLRWNNDPNLSTALFQIQRMDMPWVGQHPRLSIYKIRESSSI